MSQTKSHTTQPVSSPNDGVVFTPFERALMRQVRDSGERLKAIEEHAARCRHYLGILAFPVILGSLIMALWLLGSLLAMLGMLASR